MSKVSTIGLDLAKHVFQAHEADASGEVVFRKRLRREKVPRFFAGQPACLVAMEACSGAHHWARELARPGHVVRLIPPACVKLQKARMSGLQAPRTTLAAEFLGATATEVERNKRTALAASESWSVSTPLIDGSCRSRP